MTYKKLFPIEFNNKNFEIFLDENDKRAFLEINDKGEYEYPMLEDFLALYKIYNIHDPFIDYSVPNVSFNECVKVVKNGVIGLLTVITLINSMPKAMALETNIEVTDKSVVISEEIPNNKKEYVVIKDTNDLDKYLGHVDVTKELILEAINNNKNIPEDIKELAIEEFETIYEAHPNANYRIFYENIKTLEVNIYSTAEYNKRFPSGSDANYDSRHNALNLKKGAPKDIVDHELAHTYHSIYRILSKMIIVKSEKHTALHEGMIDFMTDYVASTENRLSSYKISKDVLKYLMYLTGFTYEDYSRFGIDYLISEAEKIYPDVNFKYVSNTLKSMTAGQIYSSVPITKFPTNMYNELFEACLQKASKQNGYEPFNKFFSTLNNIKKLTDNSLINEYFQRYNQKLKELGYDSQFVKSVEENFKTYEKANCIIYNPVDASSISFGFIDENNTLYKINQDGSSSPVNKDGSFTYHSYMPVLAEKFSFFTIRVLTNSKDIKEGLTNVLKEDGKLSPHNFSTTPIYIDGKLLTTTMTGNLKIQVGFTNKDKIGFIVTDKNGKVIHKTNENLTNLSNIIPLNDYLEYYSDYYVEKVELADILNEAYVKEYQSIFNDFYNFDVVEDKIVKQSSPRVTIISKIWDREIHMTYKLSECKVYVTSDTIFASDLAYDPSEYEYIIDLDIILEFNNSLVDGKQCYIIRQDDLTKMTENYLSFLNESNVTKKTR